MSAGLRVTGVDGLPVVVTITRAVDGATVNVYSDAACTQSVTMPALVTADTSYFQSTQGLVLVSLKVGGIELGPATVTLVDGAVIEIPIMGDRDTLKRISSGDSGTSELGYAERTTNDTTTNTDYPSSTSNKISGLSVTVVGQGLPVSVEFFCPTVYHSVAGTATDAVLVINGALTGSQIGSEVSPATAAGGSVLLKRRLVLTAGTSYTFEVGKWIAAAGTGSYLGNPAFPMYLSVNR